jgi:hypothetical protein
MSEGLEPHIEEFQSCFADGPADDNALAVDPRSCARTFCRGASTT